MKLHPLHTPEMLFAYARLTGEYFDTKRCTGRTTALALRYIASAMQNPHQWMYVRDHHDSTDAHENLTYTIVEMVRKLGLQHFHFRRAEIMFS